MSKHDVFTMPIAELQKNVEKAKRLLGEIGDLLPGLDHFTEDDRRHSDGKLRHGEAEALSSVADTVDFRPQYFAPLADKDGGTDPKKFETGLLRDHLARRELLNQLDTTMSALSTELGDTVLSLGEAARGPLLAAYAIARTIAAQDDAVHSKLATALNFYGKIGRRGAMTRASKPTTPSAK